MQQLQWFKKSGWTYLAIHAIGYLVTLMAIIFIVPVIMAIARNMHCVADDLYHIFIPYLHSFSWKWIAEKTSVQVFTK